MTTELERILKEAAMAKFDYVRNFVGETEENNYKRNLG
jgi:hypothetical protein